MIEVSQRCSELARFASLRPEMSARVKQAAGRHSRWRGRWSVDRDRSRALAAVSSIRRPSIGPSPVARKWTWPRGWPPDRRGGTISWHISRPSASTREKPKVSLGGGVPPATRPSWRRDDRVQGGIEDVASGAIARLPDAPPRPAAARSTSRKTSTAPIIRPSSVPDRGGAVVDRPLGPVPGDQDRVVGEPDDRPLPQGPHAPGSRPPAGSAR